MKIIQKIIDVMRLEAISGKMMRDLFVSDNIQGQLSEPIKQKWWKDDDILALSKQSNAIIKKVMRLSELLSLAENSVCKREPVLKDKVREEAAKLSSALTENALSIYELMVAKGIKVNDENVSKIGLDFGLFSGIDILYKLKKEFNITVK